MKKLLILLIIAFTTATIFAQEDDGDKTLPGEGEQVEIVTVSTDLQDEDAINTMLEQGATDITLGVLILEVDFSDEDDWEFYEEENRFVMVDDNVYVAQVEDNQIIWGQNTDNFEDGVIELVITQDGGSDDNAFGVMCRAHEDNNIEGYHFWITSEGFAGIVLYEDGEGYTNLSGWVESDAINPHDENVIHAVCVGNYLAMYVNGELIAEVEDDVYEDGVTGFSIRNFQDDEFSRALYDNLSIWEAES